MPASNYDIESATVTPVSARDVDAASSLVPGPESSKESNSSTGSQLGLAVACGIVFGVVINKSGVYNATVLRNQFNFSNWTMMLMFLAATASSTLSLNIMKQFEGLKRKADVIDKSYRKEIGVPASVLGAFLLGIGMTVAGACPGTVWVQLGAGSLKSLFTLAGGVTGALAYAVGYPYFSKFVAAYAIPSAKASFSDYAPKHRLAVAFLFIAMLSTVIVLVSIFGVKNGLQFLPTRDALSTTWNPVFAGMFIGGLQLPLTLMLKKNVGSASSFVTLVAQVVRTEKLEILAKKRSGIANWWQVVYVLGAAAGSALSTGIAVSTASDVEWYRGDDISIPEAIIGGFLIIFGARMASGCTSGHGISGAGHLMIRSYACIAGIFAGAIATRYALML